MSSADVPQAYLLLFFFSFCGGWLIQIFFTGWSLCYCTKSGQKQRQCKVIKIKPFLKNFQVPPLVGMMMVPFIIYSAAPSLFRGLNSQANSLIRRGTFGLVLFKAGLGLDLRLMKKVYRPILKMAFIPQLIQASIAALFAIFLFSMPVALSFAFGYLLAGGSTSVCVPLANNLQDEGYGVEKNIPTIIILAVTIDAMFALTAVNFLVSLEYSSSNLFGSGPGAAVGLGLFEFVFSIIFGILLAFLIKSCFHQSDVTYQQISSETTEPSAPKSKCCNFLQFLTMLLCSNATIFVPALLLNLKNFGYICTVTMNAFLRLFWKSSRQKKIIHSRFNSYFYFIGQYFLFGLIGTAIDVNNTDTKALRDVLIVIFVALLGRVLAVFFVLSCSEKMLKKQRWVVAFTWIAKATVQVALGGLVNEKEDDQNSTGETSFGTDFAALSVFSILICAPLGGVLGGSFAKRWLPKESWGNEKEAGSEVKAIKAKNEEGQIIQRREVEGNKFERD